MEVMQSASGTEKVESSTRETSRYRSCRDQSQGEVNSKQEERNEDRRSVMHDILNPLGQHPPPTHADIQKPLSPITSPRNPSPLFALNEFPEEEDQQSSLRCYLDLAHSLNLNLFDTKSN